MPNLLMTQARRLTTSHADLLAVVTSGILGGLLAAPVQALVRNDGNLPTFAIPALSFGQYLFFGLCGAIAAAVSVYVAANSQRDDLKRLFFFGLICGITFPAILIKTLDPTVRESQQQIAIGKTIATNAAKPIAERAAAAEAITTSALENAPAGQVDSQTQASIASNTSAIIKSLQSEDSPAAATAARNIFEAARDAGYVEVQAGNVAPPQPDNPQ